jgi:rfaE bifunctional protein nucleotidyltransferase chain/domain
MNCPKYFPLNLLKKEIEKLRGEGKTIALANGGFDLIHIGHIRYLKSAKECADILVVALNSDRSLKGLKGDGRALIDENGRVSLLGSFSFVDYVTVFNESRVTLVLETLKPDYHCKGSDYTVDSVPERDTVKSFGGKIKIVGGEKIRSTSDIVRQVQQRFSSTP